MSDLRPLWAHGVLDAPNGPRALVVIQPTTHELHESIRLRMRRAGYSRVGRHHWLTADWPYSPTSAVDIVAGDLIRITTGQASIYTADHHPVTPRWQAAARAQTVLVGLLPPGTLPDDIDLTVRLDLVGAAAQGRLLLGAMTKARFDQAVHRPAGPPR